MSPAVSDLVEHVEEALRSMAPTLGEDRRGAIHADDEVGLWPNERVAISRAVAIRRVEFATGRALLRRLIGGDLEIPVGPDRRPQFPAGVSGTLAHDRDVAVAATTTRPTCRALGVDIEPSTVLEDDIARAICRPEERHLDAHLVFVLKEAAYKAWSSLGGRLLDHCDVAVTVEPSDRTFTATVIPDGTSLTGRYATVANRYLALVVVDETHRPLDTSRLDR